MSFIILIIVFGGLMFFMTQSQKKQQKKQKELLSSIGNNDKVMTNAGIVGTVNGIKGDVFYIETENGGKLAIYRANVTKKLTDEEWTGLHDVSAPAEVKSDKKEKTDDKKVDNKKTKIEK
jgi:preprotein translocase subunit YajC